MPDNVYKASRASGFHRQPPLRRADKLKLHIISRFASILGSEETLRPTAPYGPFGVDFGSARTVEFPAFRCMKPCGLFLLVIREVPRQVLHFTKLHGFSQNPVGCRRLEADVRID